MKRIFSIVLVFVVMISALGLSTLVYAAEADYQVKSLMVTGGSSGTALSISWFNPSVGTISDIKLYDVTNGKTEIEFTPNKESGKINRVMLSNVTANTTYKYRLEMSFTDHETVVYDVYRYTSSSENNKYTAPSKWNRDNVPIDNQFSTVKEENENTALRMVSTQSETKDFAVNQTVDLTAGKGYKVTFTYKGNVNNFYVKVGGSQSQVISSRVNTDEWTTVTKEWQSISDVSSKKLVLKVANNGGVDVLIDNVTLQMKDDQGNYGENLIQNGDFENSGDTCGEVTNVTTQTDDRVTTVNWTNPTDNKFLHTRVYLDDGENLLLRAELPNTENSYSLDASGYEVVVKAVDKYGREVVTIPDLTIESFGILSSDVALNTGSSVVPGDSITSKAVIVVNKDNVETSPVLLFACYNGTVLDTLQLLNEESATVTNDSISYFPSDVCSNIFSIVLAE